MDRLFFTFSNRIKALNSLLNSISFVQMSTVIKCYYFLLKTVNIRRHGTAAIMLSHIYQIIGIIKYIPGVKGLGIGS